MVEGVEYPLRPQTLLLTRPYEFHYVCPDAGTEYDRYVITVTAPVGSSVYDVKALFFGGARLAIANNAKVSVSASAIVIQHSAYSDPI